MSLFNCSVPPSLAESTNCTLLDSLLDQLQSFNCSSVHVMGVEQQYNFSNCSMVGEVPTSQANYKSLDKAVTLFIIFFLALIGNILTIIVVSKFKIHKVPDVLVIGLALTDLLATLVPVPMSIYVYISGNRYEEGTVACSLYGTLAQFTRYSSALIVTLISVERYFAINRPFIYRKHATPRKFVFILIICWLVAFALAVAPAIHPGTAIIPHGGICLFDFVSDYSYSVIIYTGIQYVIVMVCFVLVSIQLLKVYRRRKKLKVQENYNRRSEGRAREREVKFNKPNLTARISDLGKSIKKAAPIITEKFQLGVEAQFARMLFVVVLLFYVSWTTTVIIIIIALARQNGDNLEEAIFWGVRLTVISTALNPFVYGLLARQYRLAYYYVIRLWASYCCKCVDPPLKDVFAAARNVAQDQRPNTRRDSRYSTQHSHDGSFMARSSELPILTSAHMGTTTFHDELTTIHEEEFMSSAIDSSIIAEHSTFIPSAGELASTVIIPIQARDSYNEESNLKDVGSKQRSASLHDIMDSDTFLGPTAAPHPGVENPLTALGLFSDFSGSDGDGTERGVSDIEMEEGRAGPTRAFNNPAYDLENTTGQPVIPPPMIAASSTDDIILLSKKNKISPRHPIAMAELSSRDQVAKDSSISTQAKKKKKFEFSNGGAVHTRIRVRHSSSPPAVSRKESFTAEGLVTNIDDFINDSRLPSREKCSSDGTGRERGKPHHVRMRKRHQPLEQARSHDLLDTSTEGRGARELSPPLNLNVDDRQRRSTSLPPSSQSGVQSLRQQFESLSSSSPTPPVTPEDTNVKSSPHPMIKSPSGTGTGTGTEPLESGTGTRMGRRNSNGNSDSGRESMIMDSESIHPAV